MGRDSDDSVRPLGTGAASKPAPSTTVPRPVASSRAAGGQPATSPQRPWAESSAATAVGLAEAM